MIHFAGLKAVGESVAKPLLYYNNNLIGTINLYEFMSKYGCNKVCPYQFTLRINVAIFVCCYATRCSITCK